MILFSSQIFLFGLSWSVGAKFSMKLLSLSSESIPTFDWVSFNAGYRPRQSLLHRTRLQVVSRNFQTWFSSQEDGIPSILKLRRTIAGVGADVREVERGSSSPVLASMLTSAWSQNSVTYVMEDITAKLLPFWICGLGAGCWSTLFWDTGALEMLLGLGLLSRRSSWRECLINSLKLCLRSPMVLCAKKNP